MIVEPVDRPRDPGTSNLQRLSPVTLVGIAVVFNLLELRSETRYVPLVNDSSMHAQMVRYATTKIEAGQNPLGGWFPFLSLGSPQFLHYQSLGAMLAGLFGTFLGADHAFNWSLYLLWSTWPISVYLGARLFNLDRWACAVAAACSTMLVSVPGVGFESSAYLWIGFGVWSQLFAMWTLPLAWGLSWRAIALRKPIWPAALFVALTICFHYITGYLAILALPLWVLIRPSELWLRLRRVVVVGLASFFLAAWALVPLMLYGKWATINESLQGTTFADSYGARQVLDWLFRGQILDSGRFPVVTILAAIGFVECARRVRRDEPSRALIAIFLISLLLFFGRPTLGPLLDLLPRSHDLFFRRFISGVQLSALMFAGVGAITATRLVGVALHRIRNGGITGRVRPRIGVIGTLVGPVVLVIVILAPAWIQLASYDRADAAALSYQGVVDTDAGSDIQSIVSAISILGPGRVYAGLPTNWGQSFVVGDLPVFKYLSNLNVDVVGYTLRTASLMTNPEAEFDERNLADYQIFGVRYIVLPSTRTPPVAAHLVTQVGIYQLWIVPTVTGYFQLAETADPISEDRSDIGANNDAFLESDSAALGIYPTVAYAGGQAGISTDPAGIPPGTSLGLIVAQHIDLADGTASAVIRERDAAVLVMKVSYDPGWQATVDGARVNTEMIAPALLGVPVGPGSHVVALRYVGYQHYPLLIALGIGSFVICIVLSRARHRIRIQSPEYGHVQLRRYARR